MLRFDFPTEAAILISAEIRWFWQDNCPETVRKWFHHSGLKPFGENSRRDRYFHQRGNTEIGIKIRDESTNASRDIEIKGSIAQLPALSAEIWGKWKSNIIPSAQGTVVRKQRWLRKLSLDGPAWERQLGGDEKPAGGAGLPTVGCNIELTKVYLEGETQIWWTLGFEAFGDLMTAPPALARTLDILRPPVLGGAKLSYPQWLDQAAGGTRTD